MNTTCLNPTAFEDGNLVDEAIAHESTYALLVRSEEKERSLLETALCVLCALSAIVAIWQFAHQPIQLPLNSVATVVEATPLTTTTVPCATATHS